MAHEISMMNGKGEAMFAGKAAWHGLGTVLPDAVDSATALRTAGLDWSVTQHDLNVDGVGLVPDHVANVRSDCGKVLGVVGRTYSPVQNVDAFRFLDNLLGDGVRYESAGALRDGRRVWMLARLPDEVLVKGHDRHVPYMLCCNGHDGSMAFSVMPTLVRVVCANTMRMAVNAARLTWTTRHLGDVQNRVSAARDVLMTVRSGVASTLQTLNYLADTVVSDADARMYFSDIVPMPDDASSRVQDRVDAERRLLWNLYAVDAKQAGFKGSAFGCWEAVTDFLDHYAVGATRGGDGVSVDERRFERIAFRDIAVRKDQAWKSLLGRI